MTEEEENKEEKKGETTERTLVLAPKELPGAHIYADIGAAGDVPSVPGAQSQEAGKGSSAKALRTRNAFLTSRSGITE